MRLSCSISKLLFASLGLCQLPVNAQNCPPNIDFEWGNFANWNCYIGGTAAINGDNVISLYPSAATFNRHTMYSYPADAGATDYYGHFPVLCPNGSGHSVRLGNPLPGTEAEGLSYEFTIPAGQNVYSLIYHYAVVFQDPNHRPEEQPRMEIEITNVTDNTVISCSSFTFIPYGTLLPGFFESPNPDGDTPVWCKDWSAVSVNLNGLAGKTIRLFFKTADCTFRRHFGYGYLDVNSECSDEFTGAKFCPDDTAVNVVAPYGYQSYTWFNNGFSQVLGEQQTIRFSPPPPVGTTIAVTVVPYAGYGCLDTLYARLINTLTVEANAGRDTFSCNRNPVPIGDIAKPGLTYTWTPTIGLNNPNISNPLASPTQTTSYVLATRHDGGGCLSTDTVVVRASVISNDLQVVGNKIYCVDSGDSTIFIVKPADSIQWYKDGIAIKGAHQTQFRATKSGTYYAMLFDNFGCTMATEKQTVVIDVPKPGITYPIEYAVIDIPVFLEARQIGSTALWSPGTFLDNPKSFTPSFKSSSDQLYTVEIRTPSGCVTVDTQLVKIVSHVDLFVPTAFTPNGDGLNEVLRPTLMGIKQLKYFRVFNRWGQLLYETTTERAGWDGTQNGTKMPTQVVVWLAEGIGVDGKTYMKKGTSTLVR